MTDPSLQVAQTTEGADSQFDALLEEAVSRGTPRVPPYPLTALRLQKILASDDYSVNDLVNEMRADPVFAGNILRLANTSFYRRGGEVTSLPVAVGRIGARELTRLAMSAALAQVSTSGGPLRELRRRAWREAVASALLCEALAELQGADPAESFVAGLLHDVGKTLAIGVAEDLIVKKGQNQARSSESWWQLIERYHIRLGVTLAERWQLPGALGAAIALHHDRAEQDGALIKRVNCADAIVSLMESHLEVTSDAVAALGLDAKTAEALSKRISRVPEFITAFEAESPEDDVSRRSMPSPILSAPKTEFVAAPVTKLLIETHGGVFSGQPWVVCGISSNALIVQSSVLVPSHLLIDLSLKPSGIRFWAIVFRCEQLGDSKPAVYELTLRPFALNAEATSKWNELVATACLSGAA